MSFVKVHCNTLGPASDCPAVNPPYPATPHHRAWKPTCLAYWPTGRQGSKIGLGSGASGSGAGAGGTGSAAGAIGFGATLRGAAFLAAGFGAALRGFAFAFAFLVFFALAADFRAATFLRAPLAAALPRAAFRLAFLLVALAMLSVSSGVPPRATSRRVAEIASQDA